jgi:uncharacterized protein (TIGR03067 family)
MRLISGTALLAVCALVTVTARGDDKKVSIEGTYLITGVEAMGKVVPAEVIAKGSDAERTIKITATQLIASKEDKEDPADYTIDTTKTPHQITITAKKPNGKDEKMLGIFKVDGDKLTICAVESGKEADRPKEFKTTADNKAMILVLEKKK